MQDDLYTIPEVAKLLKCSTSMVYYLIHNGKLECNVYSQRFKLVSKKQIDAYIEKKEANGRAK